MTRSGRHLLDLILPLDSIRFAPLQLLLITLPLAMQLRFDQLAVLLHPIALFLGGFFLAQYTQSVLLARLDLARGCEAMLPPGAAAPSVHEQERIACRAS
jgi:hypothetical protein